MFHKYFIHLFLVAGVTVSSSIIRHHKPPEHKQKQTSFANIKTNAPPATPTPTVKPTPTLRPSPTPTPTLKPLNPLPIISPTPTKKPANTVSAKVTFYGWVDNSPPGNGIAYSKRWFLQAIHDVAGGTGTYSDPLTFAANEQQFAIGTRIYLPYLKKYAIKEDLCGGCGESGQKHVDIWMESNDRYPLELDSCERAFTREQEMIEIDPPGDRPVDTTPLFNLTNGLCQIR